MFKKILLITLVIVGEGRAQRALTKKYQCIASEIKEILDGHPELHVGCEIYSLKNKKHVFSSNEHHLFVPASNVKIITALLAHEYLGSNYRFETTLMTDGSLMQHKVHGNLYLQGSGDPSLKQDDIYALIKNLRNEGITHISGNLYIDHSLFDHECFAPGSFLDNLGYAWNTPTSGFMVDKKPIGIQMHNQVAFMNNKSLQNMFFDAPKFLQESLQHNGIDFTGSIRFGRVPKKHLKLAVHYSQPLRELSALMLKESDNLYADCLFKKLGVLKDGVPGTWQKGSCLMKEFLEQEGICAAGSYCLQDGSGRSRYNVLTPHQILMSLRYAYKQKYFNEFKESLSIAGIDGSLHERMIDIAGRVKAKTGTLSGVSALSGYIETDSDLFAFAILVNGYVSESLYNPPCKSEIEDAICRILVYTDCA